VRFLGNLLWFLTIGLLLGLSWCLVGLLWCVTIVGIPVGMQCFKIAGYSFFPFGKRILDTGGTLSFIFNFLWLLFGGLELALTCFLAGILFCVTIIGIPFGKKCFALASLCLFPFGKTVMPE